MTTGNDQLGRKLAQRRAREEAERIAEEVQARGQAVPSSLAYALQSQGNRTVRLDLGDLEVSIVLGPGQAASPDDVWAEVQRLAIEG